MHTRYFRIETQNNPVTSSQVMSALSNTYTSDIGSWGSVLEVNHIEDNPAIAEMMQMNSGKQQPTVPIQFVYYVDKGDLYNADMIPNAADCTVEQIGAVLYVRGKGE